METGTREPSMCVGGKRERATCAFRLVALSLEGKARKPAAWDASKSSRGRRTQTSQP